MFELRNYQKQCVNAVINDLDICHCSLFQAPCGAGKTVIFSHIIKHYNGAKILVIAHQSNLLLQAKAKFQAICSENNIGVFCASISSKRQFGRITIASRQTLANWLDKIPAFDMVIIDEAHLIRTPRIKDKELKTQYDKILKAIFQKNPVCKLLGCTATPYRLCEGLIYGENNDIFNYYFPKLTYKINYSELTKKRFLVDYRGKTIVDEEMLQAMRSIGVAKGDYITSQLEAEFNTEYHIKNVVQKYNEHCADRKHTMIFAISIKHAEAICEAFNLAGLQCGVIHSKSENNNDLDAFKAGDLPIIVNVAMLTTGVDIPFIDSLIIARKTLSVILHLQILGRGMRPFEMKDDLFVLDLVGNCTFHGINLDNVNIPQASKNSLEPKDKLCPICDEFCKANARFCLACGYEFLKEEQPDNSFVESNKKIELVDFGTDLLFADKIKDVKYSRHKKKGKPDSVKVEYFNKKDKVIAMEWVCPEHVGYAKIKFRGWWEMRSEGKTPFSVTSFLRQSGGIAKPKQIKYALTGNFYTEIKEYIF